MTRRSEKTARSDQPDAQLIAAARAHKLADAERALAAGANPNTIINDHWPVMAWSAQMGGPKSDVPIVRLLLQHGADPNAPRVIASCRVELLEELLAGGGHIDGPQRNGEPLFYAIAARSKQDKALALLDAGARIDFHDSSGQTPLISAARYARSKVVARLIALGADTTGVDHTGRSALRHAIEGLASSIDSEKAAYRTIIHELRQRAPAQPEDLAITAIALEDVGALADMLDRGMDANVIIPGNIGFIGITPATLMTSAGGLLGMLTGGLDQSRLDPHAGGTTLLMWAVALENLDIIRLLLARGADPNQKTADGISAFDIAASKGNATLQSLLSTPGGSLEVSDDRTRATRLEVDLERTNAAAATRVAPDGADADRQLQSSWDVLSIEHVRERTAAYREAAERALAVGLSRYGAADSGIPDICPEHWMRPFSCALAAASLLRNEPALTTLARWVTPERPRGARSPMYNEHYFRWPLYQIWAAMLGNRTIDPAWRTMIQKETAKLAKLLLAATDATAARDEPAVLSALGKAVTLHKKNATHRGTVLADRVLQSDICFVASEARRAGLLSLMKEDLADWVLAEV